MTLPLEYVVLVDYEPLARGRLKVGSSVNTFNFLRYAYDEFDKMLKQMQIPRNIQRHD